ncbi:MAG: ABC transporter permease [Chloroflexi bacterium]|nr:ABC transporter permease [Chloroflexota bacterium]
MVAVATHLRDVTRRPVSFVGLVLRRIDAYRLLALPVLIGLLCTAGLLVSVPLYAEAVTTVQLRRALLAPIGDQVMPQSAILVRYQAPRAATPLTAARYRQADETIRQRLRELLPYPVRQSTRLAQTEPLPIIPPATGDRVVPRDAYLTLAALAGLEDQVDVVEGRLPRPGSRPGDAVEALLSTEGLDELGLAVGDDVQLAVARGAGQATVTARIVGRWQPRRPADAYWFNLPAAYRSTLLVPEETFWAPLLAQYARAPRELAWYAVVDPTTLRAADADRLLAALGELRVDVQGALNGANVDASPEEVLEIYRQRTFFLQVLLLVLSAPIVAVLVQFVAGSVGMVLDRQRAEVALLKSRGATTFQVLSLSAVESAIFGAAVVLLAPALGALIAELLGQSTGFLTFGARSLLPVRVGPESYLWAGGAAAIASLAVLIPAFGAARHSIVTYKQSVSRPALRARLGGLALDALALAVAAYAFSQLSQRRSVLPVGRAGDTFADPLLLLAPTLGIFAGARLAVRVYPLAVNAAERLIGPILGVTPLLAVRQIARQPAAYATLVLMLALTTGLGVFSAAVAATVERNQRDAAAYQVGADLRLTESGLYDPESETWTLLPVADHLAAGEVQAAARVLRLTAQHRLAARPVDVTLLGVDAVDFAAVARWRSDYADRPLGDLADALAAEPVGLLLDRRLLAAFRLNVGDQVSLGVRDQTLDFQIVGALVYLPTVDPGDGPFAVANVDSLFDRLGAQPHDVWLKLADGADLAAVERRLRDEGIPIVRSEALADVLVRRQEDATRSGVFGLLSVGFLLAAALSVFALLLQTVAAFRRRLHELGVLRALGLSLRQLAGLAAIEQGFLILSGVGSGTALGLLAAAVYVPYLQLQSGPQAGVPPFVVEPIWADLWRLYAPVAVFAVLALPLTVHLIGRLRVNEAIKFGEERV